MFPEIPSDLSELSDEELAALNEQVVAWFNENRDNAELAELQHAAEVAESIRAEEAARTEAAEARDAEVAELATRISPPTDEAEPEGEEGAEETPPAEGEGETPPAGEGEGETPAPEETPEQIAAAAAPPPARREPARPRAPRSMQPRETAPVRATITAAADIPNVPAGRELTGLREVAELMITRQSHLGRGRADADDRVLVASIRAPRPSDDRYLSALDGAEANGIKIGSATTPEALVAAGGLCAPTEGYYDQLVIADDSRPVRDALIGFGADRGGIRFTPPPSLSDVTSGITRVTAAQDASSATKGCVTITCPATTEVTIAAISECLQVGNFRGRTYPEQVEAWMRLLGAQHARVAETALLDGIATCSTAVTAAQQYGTARQVIAQGLRAVAGYRSRQRMRPDARLRWMGPAWLLDAMVADLVNSGGAGDVDFYAQARASVDAAFNQLGVTTSWYMDTKTGGGQVWGAQAVGALNPFPSTAVWYLFAEGSFLFLDGGELDLGLVRDSTLNAANNFQMFSETFENVACVGPQSLEVTATLCADGTYAPAGTDIGCP